MAPVPPGLSLARARSDQTPPCERSSAVPTRSAARLACAQAFPDPTPLDRRPRQEGRCPVLRWLTPVVAFSTPLPLLLGLSVSLQPSCLGHSVLLGLAAVAFGRAFAGRGQARGLHRHLLNSTWARGVPPSAVLRDRGAWRRAGAPTSGPRDRKYRARARSRAHWLSTSLP